MTNVEALAKILGEAEYTGDTDLAEWLASKGILAVDSLTDEQAVTVLDGRRHGDQCGGDLAVCEHLRVESLRAALRRCATGEAEP